MILANIRLNLTIGLCLLVLSGCSIPNKTVRIHPQDVAETVLAPSWQQAESTVTGSNVDSTWWHYFNSPELNQLIETADQQSMDLASAIARIHQAESQLIISSAALLPTVNGSASASRSGEVKHSLHNNSLGLGLSTYYEVDFWDKNKSKQHASKAALRASHYDYNTVYLTLTANIAKQWLQAVSLNERLNIAQLNVKNAQRILTLIEARINSGAGMPLEQAQQQALLASLQRTTAALIQQRTNNLTTIALLLGQTQRLTITESLVDITMPVIPHSGLPSDLLLHRPDIALAEAALSEAEADIAVARAAMMPQLSLTAEIDSHSNIVSQILHNPLYSLAANLIAPIFNAGSLAAQHQLSLAVREQLLANYQTSLLNAFADVDVDKALTTLSGLNTQVLAHAEQLKQTLRAFELAEIRYRAGADTLLTLLNSQTSLYAAEDSAIQLRQQQLQASVSLYQALGGGWSK